MFVFLGLFVVVRSFGDQKIRFVCSECESGSVHVRKFDIHRRHRHRRRHRKIRFRAICVNIGLAWLRKRMVFFLFLKKAIRYVSLRMCVE